MEDCIPVGLLALMASLKETGHAADIYKPRHIHNKEEDYLFIAEDILGQQPLTVGFSTWCHSFPASLLIAGKIKDLDKKVPVIFGGPQVSVLARESMEKYPCIDFVLKGEADRSLPQLISLLKDGSDRSTVQGVPEESLPGVNGLLYRSPGNGDIIENAYECLTRELDDLPVPEYKEIFDQSNLQIDAGRGCPFRCKYCSTNLFFSQKYRIKSPQRILSEIDYCRHELGVSRFGLNHDMLTLKKDFMNDLCTELISYREQQEEGLSWTCSARPDCVSGEMLRLMQEAGCKAVFFGVESGSERMQRLIGKKLKLKEVYRKLAKAVELGIEVTASYMTGFPEETPEDIELSLKSCIRATYLGAAVQMSALSVLPGTCYYQHHKDQLLFDGRISGFSRCSETGTVTDMIQQDRDMFSSFYYLPPKGISRENQLFIVRLVNQLSHFLPTLRCIWDFISSDMEQFSILEYIRKNAPRPGNKPETGDADLNWLTDAIRDLLSYLHARHYVKTYAWEVFAADAIKAIVLRRYIKWQFSRASEGVLPQKVAGFKDADILRPIPAWRLYSTSYNIAGLVEHPLKNRGTCRFRKGRHHFAVVPLSEFRAGLKKLSKRHLAILNQLEEMPVGEFTHLACNNGLSERKAGELLDMLIRLNMVQILPI